MFPLPWWIHDIDRGKKNQKKTTTRIEFIAGRTLISTTNLTFVWTRTYRKTINCESDENESNNNQISKYDDSIMRALIPTDANLVITRSRNPQSRLRSDPRKLK